MKALDRCSVARCLLPAASRASLDKVRGESEALIAPVDGVIADGMPVAGQMTQPNAVVFHIVDPARLWVEALSYEALAGT